MWLGNASSGQEKGKRKPGEHEVLKDMICPEI